MIARGEAERIFAMRGAAGSVEPSKKAWEGVLGRFPDDPRALGRLSQLAVIEALLDPEHATALHTVGREYGFRCLATDPGFAAAVTVDHGRLTPAGVDTLEEDAMGCLLWTLVNGLLLVEDRGPGAALDLEELSVLKNRLVWLSKRHTLPSGTAGLDHWCVAMVTLLDPRVSDREPARVALEAAIEAASGNLLYARTLAEWFPDTRAELQAYPYPSPDPLPLENAVYKVALDGLLVSTGP